MSAGVYELVGNLAQLKDTEVQVFKYQLKSNNGLLPLLLKPVWKCGDKETQLMLAYQFNESTLSWFNPADIIIASALETEGEVIGVDAVPVCEYDEEHRGMVWRVGAPDRGIHKIAARVRTSSRLKPGVVNVSFGVDCLASGVGIEVEEGIDVIRRLESGHYICEGTVLE
jgi:Muniscin C-terminal mu homology domain